MIYFGYFSFSYYSFGVEKTNTFIRSRGSLENHTRFKTIMVRIYTRFQTKTTQKPYPLGRHISTVYSLYRGVAPLPRGVTYILYQSVGVGRVRGVGGEEG